MLKKLRFQFIALNMTIVVLVLLVAFVTIFTLYQKQNLSQVYSQLDTAVEEFAFSPNSNPANNIQSEQNSSPENKGEETTSPDSSNSTLNSSNKTSDPQASTSESQTNNSDSNPFSPNNTNPPYDLNFDDLNDMDESFLFLEIGHRERQEQTIPLALYRISSNGTVEIDAKRSSVVLSETTIEEATQIILTSPEGHNIIHSLNLIFSKKMVGGTTYVAFADSNVIPSVKRLAFLLLGIGLVSCLIFLIVSLFFSKWALKPVSAAWNKQKQFVSDASHDLKTPLTVILANNAILFDHPQDSIASQSQWLESTQHESLRMQTMIEEMLLLAQLDEGKKTDEKELLDYSDLVQGVVLQYESVAYEQGHTLTADICEGISLKGHASRLERLVSTLLDNACKYAGEKGKINISLTSAESAPKPRAISLSQTTSRLQAELTVNNTGLCIDPEDLEHIFDRFFSVDKARNNSNSSHAKSHGLGLAIAKAIAEEHRGTITATSSPSTGTSFIVRIPL